MNTTPNRTKGLHRLLSGACLLAAVAYLSACSSGGGLTAPDDENPTRLPTVYQVQIQLDKITVNGDCDANPLIGDPNPGEFEVTIEFWARDPNDKYVKVETRTGSFTRHGGDAVDLDELYEFKVMAGKNYYVGFKATEIDGIGNEDDYVGYDQDVNTAGGQLEYDHELSIGGSGCGMSLSYTATEISVI